MHNFDFEGGFIDPSSAQSLAKAVHKSVTDGVTNEVKKCHTDFRNIATTSGAVCGSIAALHGDDNSALPTILPVFNAAWPDAVMAEWNTFKVHSSVGIISSLCRAYVIVDHRLLLWNFVTGKEFICFDEIPELLVALSDPVKPKSGVFQSHISKLIVAATPKNVYLIGVSIIGDDPRTAELRLFHLQYVVAAPCVIVKFAVHDATGRIFCAGADGNTYELEYDKERTVYQARMKFVNHSIAFGRVPILNAVGHMLKQLRQTWTTTQPPLRDICIDQQRSLLFTLASDSTITLWKLVDFGALQRQATANHTMAVILKTLHSNVPPQLTPLIALFPTRSDRGYSLAAVAANGDVYRYVCTDSGWNASCYLDVRERSSYSLGGTGNQRDVRVAWCSNGLLLCASTPSGEGTLDAPHSPDVITFVDAPAAMLPPHQHIRDMVCSFEKETTGIVRVDAVGEIWSPFEVGATASASELVAQVFAPPKQFIVAHRHGVSVFVKLRPVDTLHAIMLNTDTPRREELLKRFQAAYATSEYCCMLLQLSTGDVNVSQVLEGPNALQSKSLTNSIHPAQRLGLALLQPVSHDIQRAARDALLRTYGIPTWSEAPRGPSGHRYISVALSAAVQASTTLLARSLFPVWEQSIWTCSVNTLRTCETLLAELRRQLDHMKADLWPDVPPSVGIPVLWEPMRATLRLSSQGAHVAPQDVRSLQSTSVHALVNLMEAASQLIRFLKLLDGSGLMTEDIRFGELLCSDERSQSLARSIGRQIVSDPTKRRTLSRMLQKMQAECPRMFTDVDVTEYQVRLEMDRMSAVAPSQIKLWAPERVREFEASVAPTAAALWSNGSLQIICQELRGMKREDSAIKLLLHAAMQMHAPASSMDVYTQRPNAVYHPTDIAHVNEKTKILQSVVSLLESAWEQNRPVAQSLLGSRDTPGAIWFVEPTDEMAHCFLFDWFLGTRDADVIQKQMEDTVMASRSPFLASYLERCSDSGSLSGKHYATYLRIIKKDFKAAVVVLSRMAQSPLFQVPATERLRIRLECWKEAHDCALEGHLTAEEQEVDRKTQLTSAQLQLVEAIRHAMDVDGENALHDGAQKLHVALSSQLDENDLMAIAEEVTEFGGGDVQLAVLCAFANVNPTYYMSAVENCFRRRNVNVAHTAEQILKKYGRVPAFPIGQVLKYVERFSYDRNGSRAEGSHFAADLAAECGLEMHVVFAHYADMIEQRDVPWKGYNPLDGVVPDAFLCYSMALIVKKVVSSPQLRANATLTAPIVHAARELIAVVGGRCRNDPMQRRSLEHAERMLDQCQTTLRHDTTRLHA